MNNYIYGTGIKLKKKKNRLFADNPQDLLMLKRDSLGGRLKYSLTKSGASLILPSRCSSLVIRTCQAFLSTLQWNISHPVAKAFDQLNSPTQCSFSQNKAK